MVLTKSLFPFQLDVARQNYVSRTKHEHMFYTQIDHVAFSDDGSWLATVSSIKIQCSKGIQTITGFSNTCREQQNL